MEKNTFSIVTFIVYIHIILASYFPHSLLYFLIAPASGLILIFLGIVPRLTFGIMLPCLLYFKKSFIRVCCRRWNSNSPWLLLASSQKEAAWLTQQSLLCDLNFPPRYSSNLSRKREEAISTGYENEVKESTRTQQVGTCGWEHRQEKGRREKP